MKISEKIIELKKSGAKLPSRVIERTLFNKILPWIDREEIIVITGARQTGKSVLMFQLIYDYLLPKTTNIHYFNLDVPAHRKLFNNQDYLISLTAKTTKKTYIFIDEIQRLNEPGLFLKGIFDLHLPVKLVVSGSSALEIKSKIHEPLTGRKALFHLYPFNLTELSKGLYPYYQKSKDIINYYAIYGGYPAVVMAKTKELKLQLLKEIFLSYLDKDVKSLLHVENESAFIKLIRILSSQIGNIINKDEISQSLSIHKQTLDNYLFYLEQTFVLDFVRPFYRNPRKELLKNPKVYFHDLGLRNYAVGAFSEFDYRPDKGALFENLVYLSLQENIEFTAPVNFWRSKSGAEVDFIVMDGLNPIPYEAKAAELKESNITKSLRSFLNTYTPKRAYCVNLALQKSIKFENTSVNFLLPPDLLKERLSDTTR